MKKISFMLLLIFVFLSSNSLNAAVFPDIKENHFSYKYAKILKEKNIIVGDEKGNFNPDKNITYAEFIKALAISKGIEPKKQSKIWYGEFVDFAEQNNFLSGLKITDYNKPINRGEVSLIIKNVLDLNSEIPDRELYSAQIKDFIDTKEIYKDSILSCFINGVMIGDKNIIRSESNIKRSETFVVLCKIINPEERKPPLDIEQIFYSQAVPKNIMTKMFGKTINDNSLVNFSDLRLISVCYYGYDSKIHAGQIVMHKSVENDIIEIFKILYKNKFPIEKIKLADDYNANDELSMSDNNTSGFNDRPISSSSRSYHQFGLAIDINPLYNPYYIKSSGVVLPAAGKSYIDRNQDIKEYIKSGDICVETFKKYGWEWGGDWSGIKDYQHFEKTNVFNINKYKKPANALKPSQEINKN